MANHTSAKKAAKQTVKKNLINKNRSSKIKTCVKKVAQAVQSGSAEEAKNALIIAQSELMKGVTKNILKLNTASRKVSQLTKKVQKMIGRA